MKNDVIIIFVNNLLIHEILTLLLECNVPNAIAVCGLGKALDTASNQYGESILKIRLSFLPRLMGVYGLSINHDLTDEFRQMHLAQWRR